MIQSERDRCQIFILDFVEQDKENGLAAREKAMSELHLKTSLWLLWVAPSLLSPIQLVEE